LRRWTSSTAIVECDRAGPSTALGSFSPPLSADERSRRRHPDGSGHEQLVQVFEVSGLGGHRIPSWGYPLAVADAGQVSRDGPGGSVVSDTWLQRGSVYAVDSIVPDPSPAQLEADSPNVSNLQDLQLPQPVPSRLAELAKSLVVGATTAYQKALDLDSYLTSPSSITTFRAHEVRCDHAVPGYGGVLSFLFKSPTGYCQQFATAFAVLARIDGLPTRIAVGFLPGLGSGMTSGRSTGPTPTPGPRCSSRTTAGSTSSPLPARA